MFTWIPSGNHTGNIKVIIMAIIICVITWYVPPAGVVELAAEVLAEPWQVWLPVWHLIHVQGVEQHLGIGGAASTLDLLQETSTFCIVGGENLETTRNKGIRLIRTACCLLLPLTSHSLRKQTYSLGLAGHLVIAAW